MRISDRRAFGRFLARGVALAGTVLVVSVCGEQGRLGVGTGPTGTGADATPPRVLNTITDPVVEITDSLRFSVQASDSTRLKKVTVHVTGVGTFAASLDSTVLDSTYTTTITTLTRAFVVPLPSNAAGRQIVIYSSAEDGSGNVGWDTDTVTVNDGQAPVVTLVSPTSANLRVGAGEVLTVVVRSVDPSGLARGGARLFTRDSALGRVNTIAGDSAAFTTFRTSRTDTFRLTVPASLRPGSYLLQGFAVDSSPTKNAGATTPDLAMSVLDVQKPSGSFANPAADSTVTAGDTVVVRFRAVDLSGVTKVTFWGYSLRGNASLGTDSVVLRYDSVSATLPLTPTDTTPIIRRLLPRVADGTAEPVYIAARVRDVGGNDSVITRRVQVVSGTRTVTFAGPAADSGVGAGDSVLVQFRVQDRRGIQQILIQGRALRGDSSLGTNNWVDRFTAKQITLPALATDTTIRRYLNASDTGRVEPVYLRVTAYTAGRGDSITGLRRIQVIQGPRVVLSSPSRDTSFAVGSALGVAVSGYDPDSVSVVGVVATGLIARRDSTVFTSPLATSQTAAIALSVPGTTSRGQDTLTPFIIDRLGNRSVGQSVVVTFVDVTPPTVAWVSPSQDSGVAAGDSVRVQVRVRDNAPGTTVTLRGRVGSSDWFAPASFTVRSTDTTVAKYLVATSSQDAAGGLVDLVASAIDAQSNSSAADSAAAAAATRRIQVTSGPYVRVESPANGDSIRLGQTGADRLITVSAFNRDTITYLGYSATGRVTLSDSAPPTRPMTNAMISGELHLVIPDTAHLGTITVTPFARTKSGTRVTGPAVSYGLVDGSLPTVRVLSPARAGTDKVAAGDSVFVRVAVADDRALAALRLEGFARRPDVFPDSLAQVVPVVRYAAKTVTFSNQVRDTVVRYLNAVLTDSTAENIYIVATAQDAAGNQAVDTVRFQSIAGSWVRITTPASPARQPIGSTMSVAVAAFDPDSVSRVGFRATGAVTGGDSLSYLSPLSTNQTSALSLAIPGTASGTVTLTPFAVDRNGQRITGPALAVALIDATSPLVDIDTPAVDSLPVAAGDSVRLHFRVRDNEGVTRVTITGAARRGDVSLGTDTVVTRFRTKTFTLPASHDTTLTRYILADTSSAVSEIVHLVVTAQDSAGNATSDTARIRLVGGPVLTMVRPVTGSATSVGKSIIIEIRGVDANGVRLLGWRATGFMTGQDSLFFGPVSGDLKNDTTFTDTLTVAGSGTGTITITPFGSDSLGDISASGSGVNISVQSAASDTQGPAVRFSIGRRVESDDSVAVSATDAGGLKYVGFVATLLSTPTDTVGADSTLESGTYTDVTRNVSLNLDPAIRFPSQVVVRGFGVDQSGNRGVSSVWDTLTVVAGKTYALPAGSRIADAIYNRNRDELYLSNNALDRIEVFSLVSNSFVASIPVGSKPWGLALWPRATADRTDPTAVQYDDSLIVANSGGTDLSIVNLVSRAETRRVRLPNYRIDKIKIVANGGSGQSVKVTSYDLSDRPEYVAAVCRAGGTTTCDSVIAVYSTTPTGGQSSGFENRGYVAWENLTQPGNVSGKSHFFWEQANVQAEESQDTIQIIATQYTAAGGTYVDTIIGGGAGLILDPSRLVFRDTTYVRSSGNYQRVVIGEGGGGLTLARVLEYDATTGRTTTGAGTSATVGGISLSNIVQQDNGITGYALVQNFIGNRASNVTAVASNFDGGTNLVRADSIYVFDNMLGQRGLLQISGAAYGMDLAPLHAFSAYARGTNTIPGDGDANSRIVFAARPDSSIDVFDTYFYGRVTDTATAAVPIPIRNALVGAVRVTSAVAGTVLTGITNQGLVVVRLPTLTNPFPTTPMRPEIALPERLQSPRRAGGASPPNE